MMAGAGGVSLHYASYDRESKLDRINAITSMTDISSPALSTSFYEPRFLNERVTHPAYPQMPTINKMGFVYAK